MKCKQHDLREQFQMTGKIASTLCKRAYFAQGKGARPALDGGR